MIYFVSNNGKDYLFEHKPYRAGKIHDDQINIYFKELNNGDIIGKDINSFENKIFLGKFYNLDYWESDFGDIITLPNNFIKQHFNKKMSFKDNPIILNEDFDDYITKNKL